MLKTWLDVFIVDMAIGLCLAAFFGLAGLCVFAWQKWKDR